MIKKLQDEKDLLENKKDTEILIYQDKIGEL
jgi:hypothetical protein